MSEVASSYVRLLWGLIDRLHDQPEAFAGGPLHIVVDDHNVEDDCIDFCRNALMTSDYLPRVNNVSAVILDMLEPLSVEVRQEIVSCRGFDDDGRRISRD